MVVVAVAGGTGAVGRTLVEAMVCSGRHEVFVLSRTSVEVNESSKPRQIAVDYNDPDQIMATLRDHQIEVVVSAMILIDDEASNAQINLIRAAARSGTVTKFIPSEYLIDYHKPVEGTSLYFRDRQLAQEEELKLHPNLTWTLIRNGLFLDYLAMPTAPKPSHLLPWSIFVDPQHKLSVLPGDGTHVLTLTHSTDLAAYVERMISLPAEKWPRESVIKANHVRVKDLADIINKVTDGEVEVVYNGAEECRNGNIAQLPANKELFADPQWGAGYQLIEYEAFCTILSNGHDLEGKDLGEIFPDVKTIGIEQFLKAAWAGELV